MVIDPGFEPPLVDEVDFHTSMEISKVQHRCVAVRILSALQREKAASQQIRSLRTVT